MLASFHEPEAAATYDAVATFVETQLDRAAAAWDDYLHAHPTGTLATVVESNAKIRIAHLDGTGDTRLTIGSDLYESDPQWSPDGSRIAFDTDRTDRDCCAWGH
jgi:Tol biopolymer transport system component